MQRWAGMAVAVLAAATLGGCKKGAPAGSEGGACYGNGTCNAPLACQAGVCVKFADGTAGGACYGNGTCNPGLSCVANVCTAPSSGTSGVATALGNAVSAALAAGVNGIAPVDGGGLAGLLDGGALPVLPLDAGVALVGADAAMPTLAGAAAAAVNAVMDGGPRRFELLPAVPAKKK